MNYHYNNLKWMNYIETVGETMDQDLKFLIYLETQPNVSQRQLAREMDISLGSVNSQMKSLIQRNWLQVHNPSPNTLEYQLTPLGQNEKEKRYLDYVGGCFHAITEFKEIIKENILQKINLGIKHFILIGEEDVIYKLVKMSFMEMKREHIIEFEKSITLPKEDRLSDTVIFYWNQELDIKHQNAQCIIRRAADEPKRITT